MTRFFRNLLRRTRKPAPFQELTRAERERYAMVYDARYAAMMGYTKK